MGDTSAPPTPGGVPLLGNGLAFSRDPVRAMEEWAAHGDVVRLEFPGESMYLVTGPELVERILVSDQDSFSIGPAQRETFGGVEDHAVTTATGDRWNRLRRALHPAFTRETIERYGDRMAAATAAYVDEAWSDGQTIDLLREMRLVTVNALADVLLDADVRGREAVVTDAADALVDRANFRRPGQLLPDWIPTPTDRRFERAVRALDEFVDGVLEERRGEAGDDVCSILLAAHDRGELSFDEVRHNVVALLLAGHDSPAVALTYTWYLLSDHPEVRKSLAREHDAVVDGERPGAESYDALELTGNVVSEALRLYPPTTGVNRQATEPVTLGGYELPAGAQFLLPQWVVHRDDRFWDDPETFDPSRWDDPADRPDFAYFPFSGGPRLCVGNDFARQELTLALSTMLGRVDLEVSADGPLSFTPSVQLRPETDLTATVRLR